MTTKRNYSVICIWGQNTSKKGRIDCKSDLTYQDAKDTQRLWANEELSDNMLEKNSREKTIECGDCSVSVVKTELFEKYEAGEIEYYEMF